MCAKCHGVNRCALSCPNAGELVIDDQICDFCDTYHAAILCDVCDKPCCEVCGDASLGLCTDCRMFNAPVDVRPSAPITEDCLIHQLADSLTLLAAKQTQLLSDVARTLEGLR